MNAPRRDGPRRDGPRRGRRDHGAHSAPPRGRVGPGRPPELDPARQAALELLTAVRTRDAYANLALPAILRRHRLRDRDAGLATELGYGTLRARGLLDAIIEACTDRPLNRVEPPLLDALRLGAYQLLRTRVPAHAAVDTTVELVRAEAGSRSAGFVNAILRKVGELDEPAWVQRLAPPAAEDPVGYAAFAHAHPRWIAQAFADALGPGALAPVASARAPRAAAPGAAAPGAAAPGAAAPDAAPGAGAPGAGAPDGPAPTGADPGPTELAAALAADDARPAVHLLGRPGEITAAELALVTGGTEAPYSPYGVQLEPGSGDVGELEVVREGLAIVQDEGSQLVALAAVRAPLVGADGGRWLDLCAGPGGKSVLLGALAALDGAAVDAVEVSEHRADLVRRAVDGLPVTVHLADGRDAPLPAGGYDRVLVDAPCSGLGALRRRPEARWRRSPDDVSGLTRLQRELLTAALRHVRPGGVVAYVTCSPHLAETVGVLSGALRRHPGVERLDARELLPGVPDLGPGPTVQLWPHRHGTDAMFLAVLRRPT
jgi:16S rRNA (cytosine967-C5)-methyltransferase